MNLIAFGQVSTKGLNFSAGGIKIGLNFNFQRGIHKCIKVCALCLEEDFDGSGKLDQI
jgi:hypothetical protein